jgi:2Fe-2S ferredoxin
MPKVTFIIDDVPQTVEFESGAVPYSHHGKPESLLDIAKHFHVPLEHACGGSCACTTCHVVVKEGANHLSEMLDDEADRLDTAWDLTPRSRLGCQAVVTGDVVCELPMYTRNYVQEGGGIQLGKSEARAQRSEALAGAVAAGTAEAAVKAVVKGEVRP